MNLRLLSRFMTLSILICILNACASMSKEDCERTDWHRMGYQMGDTGQKLDSMNRKLDGCFEKGATVDRKQLESGYTEGLKSYCTFENGESLGSHGQAYSGNCPSPFETVFLSGYRPARQEYVKRYRPILKRRLEDKDLELRRIERELYSKRSSVEFLTGLPRDRMKRDISDLESRRSSVNRDIYSIEDELKNLR